MRAIKQFKENICNAYLLQRTPKWFCSQIKKELIMSASIDIDRFHCVQNIYVFWNHANWVPAQPALPYLGQHLTGCRIIWHMYSAILIGRIAGSHAPIIEKAGIAVFGKCRARTQVLPEFLK